MRGIAARLRALFRRSTTDVELDEELRYHLDREAERNRARGMNERDARDAARRAVGNVTTHAEQAREAFGWSWLEHLAQDARYGWRALRRSPAFTTVAVLSLAFGIGANTMIFGIAYSMLFEPLPLPAPERLVVLTRVAGTSTDQSFSAPEVAALKATPGIGDITAVRAPDNAPVVVGSQRTFTTLDLVDASYFRTIALRPYRGRLIDSADVASRAPVAVISQPVAERAFGSSDKALGQTVRVFNVPVTIIGVTPAAFRGLYYPGWVPFAVPVTLAPALGMPDVERAAEMTAALVVRLRADVTSRQAELALDAVFQRCCRHDTPERLTAIGMSGGIGGGKDDARSDYAPLLYMLLAGSAVVLIIACANVANLLLVRAAARERDTAVRMSLGASRSRVVRQLLTESVLLGALGTVVAVPFAAWGTLGVESMIPDPMAAYADIVRWHAKPVLVAFTMVTAVICVALFGVVPALRATRARLAESLKSRGRGTTRSGRRFLDRAVVVAQLSLALLLVTAASLLVTTLRNLAREDGGFASAGVTIVSVETRGTSYERGGIVPLHDDILRRVRAVPGVERAGMTTLMPIAGGRSSKVQVNANGTLQYQSLAMAAVTPDYLASMGIPLIAGRDFAATDDASSEQVAIISSSVARRIFGARNPLGGSIALGRDSTRTRRIVGVAGDTKMFGLRGDPVPTVYAPVTQTGDWPFLGLTVRMPDGMKGLTRRVTDAIEASAPGVRLRKISTMRTELADSMFSERLVASIATLFGSLALLLAAIGIYGVIAFNVARRTNEIGVRMALGARRVTILRLVLGSSLRLVVVAVIIGAPLAFGAGRVLQSQLYGVRSHDPGLLLIAFALLVAVALLAAAIPARRAARIDPLVALRAD